MRLILMISSLVVSLFIVGCSENKNVDYFKKHPDEILSNAIECSTLSNKDVINNKTCLAIAELEKPLCERELKVMGRVLTPRGFIYSCDDPYYLIARPVINAKMKAAIAGQPDPVEAYLKTHPNKQ